MSASMRISSSLVPRSLGYGVGGGVGKGDPDDLGLGAVDEVPEDPPAATEALAIATLPAEAAAPTGRDARNEHPVAGGEGLDSGSDLEDRTDGLVAQDPPDGDLGDVTFQDMQVRPADGGGIDSDDGVGVVTDRGVGHVLPRLGAGPFVDKCLHRMVLLVTAGHPQDAPGEQRPQEPMVTVRRSVAPGNRTVGLLDLVTAIERWALDPQGHHPGSERCGAAPRAPGVHPTIPPSD